MDALHRMAAQLWGLVGRGRIKATDDSGPVQRAQVDVGPEGLGVRDNTPVLTHYGFFARPPAETDCIVLFVGGERTEGVVIATGAQATRVRDLVVGEAGVANEVKGTSFKLADDGKAHLVASDLIVDGISFKALVAAHNAHKHGGVQAGEAQSAGPDQTV